MNTGQTQLKGAQACAHPFCVVCSGSNPYGLGLKFQPDGDGGVSTVFLAHAALEGYPGLVHGGVIASMLDGAMTNCLFAQGIVAVMGELNVRYWKPVLIGCKLRLDRKSTRLNSSHLGISDAVFCLKKKTKVGPGFGACATPRCKPACRGRFVCALDPVDDGGWGARAGSSFFYCGRRAPHLPIFSSCALLAR